MFPARAKVGDVVTVTGPFANKMQGQVVVRFAGSRGIAVNLTGPFGGTVVVPPDAETGACTITVDGRRVFGRNCVISKGRSGGPPPARAPRRGGWYNFGPVDTRGADVGSASAGVIIGVVMLFGVLLSTLGSDSR
jgi:hypothetical protein